MQDLFRVSAILAEVLASSIPSSSAFKWENCIASQSNDPVRLAAKDVIAVQLCGQLDGTLYLCPDAEVSREIFPTEADTSSEALAVAWQRLIENSAEKLQKALSGAFGVLEVKKCRHLLLPAEAIPLGDVTISRPESDDGRIFLLLDPALRVSLDRNGTRLAGELSLSADTRQAPLDRVLDVPLSVKLRFGQRQLTPRELLELNTGSLVELDQQVEEPVDLVLGDRVIARGEVVIVDGNYGMRVLEVIEHAPARIQA